MIDRDTKVCHKCNQEKKLSEFYKNKIAKDGYQYHCKVCHKSYAKADPEKLREYRRMYYVQNKVVAAKKQREYRKNNAEQYATYMSNYYRANKEELVAYQKEYYRANKEIIDQYRNEYRRNRLSVDTSYRLAKNLRKRVWEALKGNTKCVSTIELLGCTIQELRAHIELQFQEGMTWDNYGEWHHDHIVPCAAFDLTDPEQQKLCFHYTNLQPLWAIDNIRKSNKLVAL